MSDDRKAYFDCVKQMNGDYTFYDIWKAAIEWDRKYLASLALSSEKKISEFTLKGFITSDEILKGKLDE